MGAAVKQPWQGAVWPDFHSPGVRSFGAHVSSAEQHILSLLFLLLIIDASPFV